MDIKCIILLHKKYRNYRPLEHFVQWVLKVIQTILFRWWIIDEALRFLNAIVKTSNLFFFLFFDIIAKKIKRIK